MTEPELNQETLKEMLYYRQSTGELLWRIDKGRMKVGDVAGSIYSKDGRVLRVNVIILCQSYKAEDLIWLYVTGEFPKSEIYHQDGDKTNNRFTNLSYEKPIKAIRLKRKHEITQELLKEYIHYDKDNGTFIWKKRISIKTKIGTDATSGHSYNRKEIYIFGHNYKTDKIAWLYSYGELPRGKVRHKNLNEFDDRLENLTLSHFIGEITQDMLKKMVKYDPDTGEFFKYVHHANGTCSLKRLGTGDINKYQQINCGGVNYRGHRLAWFYMYGEWPDDFIDHINGLRGDNRISNLRDVPPEANSRNRKIGKDNTSGFMGVRRYDCGWRAEIVYEGKTYHLGTHSDVHSAVQARLAAERDFGFHENHGKR